MIYHLTSTAIRIKPWTPTTKNLKWIFIYYPLIKLTIEIFEDLGSKYLFKSKRMISVKSKNLLSKNYMYETYNFKNNFIWIPNFRIHWEKAKKFHVEKLRFFINMSMKNTNQGFLNYKLNLQSITFSKHRNLGLMRKMQDLSFYLSIINKIKLQNLFSFINKINSHENIFWFWNSLNFLNFCLSRW